MLCKGEENGEEQKIPETDINLDNAHYLNEDNVFEIWYKDNKDEYE